MRINFTAIRTFSSVTEGSVACSMLQTEGLNAYLYNEELIIMDWLSGIAFGGVKLVVPENEALNAIEILSNNTSIPLGEDGSNLIHENDYFNQFEPVESKSEGQRFRKSILVYLLCIPRSSLLMMFLLFFVISPAILNWSSENDNWNTVNFFSLMFLTFVLSVILMKQVFYFFIMIGWV